MVCVAGVASSYEGVGLVALWWLDGLCRRRGQLLRGRGLGSVVVVWWSVSQAWPALTRAWDWWLCGGLVVCVAGMASSYGGRGFGGFVVAGWSVSQVCQFLRGVGLVAGWPIS